MKNFNLNFKPSLLELGPASGAALYSTKLVSASSSRKAKKPMPFWSTFPWDQKVPLVLTEFTLGTVINQFLNFLVNAKVTNTVVFQLFVIFDDGSIRSMHKLIPVNVESQDGNRNHLEQLSKSLLNTVNTACEALADNYLELTIKNIGLKYRILDSKHSLNLDNLDAKSVILADNEIKDVQYPKTMDIYLWPALLGSSTSRLVYIADNAYFFTIDHKSYSFSISNESIECILTVDGHEITRFRDTLLEPRLGFSGLQTFKREHKNTTYYYEDGILVSKTKSFEDLFIKNINPKKISDPASINFNHIALDIETTTDSYGKMSIFSVA